MNPHRHEPFIASLESSRPDRVLANRWRVLQICEELGREVVALEKLKARAEKLRTKETSSPPTT